MAATSRAVLGATAWGSLMPKLEQNVIGVGRRELGSLILWPAQMIGMRVVGIGRQRQSSILKNSPWKSLRPVSHNSRMIVTYSPQ
jgi:hypothetical protein